MNDMKSKTIGRFTVTEDYSTVCLIKTRGPKKMKEFIRFLKDNGLEPTDCGEWGKLVAELRD